MPAATQNQRNTKNTAIANQLYLEHRSRLLAIAQRNSSSKEDAEEAVQDAFALFIQHFNPDNEAPALAWITLTLKRRCWALYSRQVNSPIQTNQERETGDTLKLLHEGTETQTPEDIVERTEQISIARKNIQKLKPAERRALSYQALGYSYNEIVKQTGWSYTKVNRCITEGRARLKKLTQQQTTQTF